MSVIEFKRDKDKKSCYLISCLMLDKFYKIISKSR